MMEQGTIGKKIYFNCAHQAKSKEVTFEQKFEYEKEAERRALQK